MEHTAAVVLLGSFLLPFAAIRVAYQPRRWWQRGDSAYLEPRWVVAAMNLIGITTTFALGVWLVWPSALSATSLGSSPVAPWVGLAVGWAGVGLLWWSHATLGAAYDPFLRVDDDQVLVTEGPYRFARHPMYTALALVGVGLLLVTADALVGGSFLGGLMFVVGRRLPREEAALAERFGAPWEAWARTTWRLFPGF